MTEDPTLFAGVELGGTKCVAVLGSLLFPFGEGLGAGLGNLDPAARLADSPHPNPSPEGEGLFLERVQVATTSPDETLSALAGILAGWQSDHEIAALGIGSFGPIRIDPTADDYGRMLATPKPGWARADIAGALATGFPRHRLHTDVTAAALAEGAWGAARGLDDFVYVTIGTGVGVGIVAGGRPVTGLLHPEAGHIRIRRREGDDFPGICPAHGDCLEGLVSGPAIAARFATPPDPDDPRWAPVVDALAEALAMLLLTLSPARIVIGGGVALGRPHLTAQARERVEGILAGYLPDADAPALAERIVSAALSTDAGPLGTLILARNADGEI